VARTTRSQRVVSYSAKVSLIRGAVFSAGETTDFQVVGDHEEEDPNEVAPGQPRNL
jgi:hypothetical protein